MKKADRKPTDELRPEYKRSDFGTLVRGKYARKVAEATNVVVLEPQVAQAFPNDRAVNKALRGVLRNRKVSARPTIRSRRTRRERRAGISSRARSIPAARRAARSCPGSLPGSAGAAGAGRPRGRRPCRGWCR